MKTLAIIPARGGSKRIEKKNIRTVGGKPLIAHTIEQAQAAENLDETVISTDSEEIKQVARKHGGSVPFDRPEELATDTASSGSVVSHALNWYEDRGEEFTTICLLQVTSPLRTPVDIDEAIAKFRRSNAESLVSVSPHFQEPEYALVEDERGFLSERYDPEIMFSDEYVRSQDVPDSYFPNGAIYVADREAWAVHKDFHTPKTIKYEIPPERSFQIDEFWELELVRTLYKADYPR